MGIFLHEPARPASALVRARMTHIDAKWSNHVDRTRPRGSRRATSARSSASCPCRATIFRGFNGASDLHVVDGVEVPEVTGSVVPGREPYDRRSPNSPRAGRLPRGEQATSAPVERPSSGSADSDHHVERLDHEVLPGLWPATTKSFVSSPGSCARISIPWAARPRTRGKSHLGDSEIHPVHPPVIPGPGSVA